MSDTTALEKREWVYVMRPFKYQIARCECGNEDPDWSEYKRHLWCSSCQKDFIPTHNGVFDGPIPVKMARLLGLCFCAIDIETSALIKGPCCEVDSTSPPASTAPARAADDSACTDAPR